MSSPWHRVAADPGLLESVRAACGRDDVLDLLWWAEQPGRQTPAGLPDPAVAMERDRRALYREGGGPADAAAVAAAVAAHREALRSAVAAARSAIAERERADAASPPTGAAGTGTVEAPAPARRALWATALVCAVALVLGVAIGAAATARRAGTPEPTPTARSLRVFDRPQVRAIDRPAETDEVPIIERRTIRRLRTDGSIGTTLYAARAPGERVCIFVVVLAAASPPACTSPEAFATGGLTLLVRATADPVDDSGRRPIDELVLTWDPNDTVSITPFEVGSAPPRAASAGAES